MKGLLERMHVDGTVLANVGEDGVRLYIDKSTMGMLIGHRGETLDAMQYLTSLAVNRNRKQDGYTRISIDTEGYPGKAGGDPCPPGKADSQSGKGHRPSPHP